MIIYNEHKVSMVLFIVRAAKTVDTMNKDFELETKHTASLQTEESE